MRGDTLPLPVTEKDPNAHGRPHVLHSQPLVCHARSSDLLRRTHTWDTSPYGSEPLIFLFWLGSRTTEPIEHWMEMAYCRLQDNMCAGSLTHSRIARDSEVLILIHACPFFFLLFFIWHLIHLLWFDSILDRLIPAGPGYLVVVW